MEEEVKRVRVRERESKNEFVIGSTVLVSVVSWEAADIHLVASSVFNTLSGERKRESVSQSTQNGFNNNQRKEVTTRLPRLQLHHLLPLVLLLQPLLPFSLDGTTAIKASK